MLSVRNGFFLSKPYLNNHAAIKRSSRFSLPAPVLHKQTTRVFSVFKNTTYSTNTPNNNKVRVVYVAAPGFRSYNHAMVDQIKKALDRATKETVEEYSVVGDGEQSISTDMIVQHVDAAKKDSRPITLFLHSHATRRNMHHELILSKDQTFTRTRYLFERLRSSLGDNYPLSIFMTGAHGKTCVEGASELPRGTTLATFSLPLEEYDIEEACDFEGMALLVQAKEFAKTVRNVSWRSSEALLYDFLTYSFRTTCSPYFAYVEKDGANEFSRAFNLNSRVLDLNRLFCEQLGKSFTAKQKSDAHLKLDDLMGQEKVDQTISKIQKFTRKWDIASQDYGSALAVTLATNA